MAGWTCIRCGRTPDIAGASTEDMQQWHLTGEGALCPDCATAEDLLAARHARLWFPMDADRARVACGCEADLGEVPHDLPAEITCLSCGETWLIEPTEAGASIRRLQTQ